MYMEVLQKHVLFATINDSTNFTCHIYLYTKLDKNATKQIHVQFINILRYFVVLFFSMTLQK